MNYLSLYCDKFKLEIVKNNIVDCHKKVIGVIEENKYVFFHKTNQKVKISDFLILTIENVCIH